MQASHTAGAIKICQNSGCFHVAISPRALRCIRLAASVKSARTPSSGITTRSSDTPSDRARTAAESSRTGIKDKSTLEPAQVPVLFVDFLPGFTEKASAYLPKPNTLLAFPSNTL